MATQAVRDSIDRALMHHQLADVVHTYGPPELNGPREGRRSTWRVTFAAKNGTTGGTYDLSTTAVQAVCAALAAAEATHVPVLAALRAIVTTLADVEIVADDSAAFERAEAALLAAAEIVAGRP